MTINVKLLDVVDFVRGVIFEKSQQQMNPSRDHIAVLRAGNIQRSLQTSSDLIYIPREIVSEAQKLREGDIAICLSSGSPQVVGKTARLCDDWDGTVGGFCGIIRPRSIDSEFLAQWLRGPQYLAWRDEQARGANIQNLRFSQLESLEIWIPSKDKQRQIASRLKAQLSELEIASQSTQTQAQETDALRASIMRDAFEHVVPVSIPAQLEEAPEGWRWRKLSDIARLESGHTPSRQRPEWWGGDVSWVSLTEIRALDGHWVESTQLRTNALGIANSAARILPRGTVCFSRTASVGFVTIMAQPMATSQDFANWVCSAELEPEFLMYALIRSRNELRNLATGATHKTIYMPTLEAFHLCAPHINEQRRIVARLKTQLAEADALRAALDVQLKELNALPQRILARAFTPPQSAA